MLEINFYGVSTITKEKALIKLLEKTIETQKKAVVFSDSLELLAKLDDILWTSSNWLPHALVSDPYKEQQLILLSNSIENLYNNPNYLFTLDNSKVNNIENIERLFVIFHCNQPEDTLFAKERWKFFKQAGCSLKYFEQDKEGKFNSVNM